MCLTGEEELHRIIGVVHQFIETLEVGEEQVSAFVRRKTTTETDDEVIGVHLRECLDDTTRVSLVLHPVVTELILDILDQFALEVHTRLPDDCIGNLCVRFPHLEVRLVSHPLLRQIFRIHFLPLGSGPCRHMDTVGNIVYVEFLGEVTGPYGGEHLLRYLTVQPGYTVGLLTSIEGEDGHGEFLRVILRIGTTHTNEVMPFDTEFWCILRHILVEQTFFEVIVSGRNRGMAGV